MVFGARERDHIAQVYSLIRNVFDIVRTVVKQDKKRIENHQNIVKEVQIE